MEEFDLVKSILNRNQNIGKVFEAGQTAEILDICNHISSISKEVFLDNLTDFGNAFNSKDVITFSSFNVVYELIEQLLFVDHPCTYLEIGNLILKTINDGAYIKYGENHSKLAQEMKLVSIQSCSCKLVQLTSFGKLVATKKVSNVDYLLNVFLLSNPLIQTIIYQILHRNNVFYKDYVSNLAKSTQIRRRSNVKLIVKRLIDYFEIENYELIDWRI